VNIKPVSVSLVTQSVERILREHPDFAGTSIERSDETNTDPAACPWVGIYRADNSFPLRVLGAGGFRGQRMNLVLMAQEADPTSGANCEDRLNTLVDKIISVLLSDTSLGGVVHTIDEFTVRYPDHRRVDDDMYMQTALIFFTALTTVGGS
jgi:hypothetical protein